MLETPHYLQNEVQIHWHGWQGPPWSRHWLFSFVISYCLFFNTSLPPTLSHIQLLAFHTSGPSHIFFPLPGMLAYPLACLCSSSTESLLTLLLSPRWRWPIFDADTVPGKMSIIGLVTLHWTLLFPHLPPLLDNQWTYLKVVTVSC